MKKILLLISFVVWMLPIAGFQSDETPSTDVRVIVDISGSMKKNDPNNLRIPAIQLFSQLLPPDSKSGVWTFGQYVNMLVPLSEVTPEWKAEALRTSRQINSVGLFTNISGAIERASFDWDEVDPNSKRSLILLTDGVVDISKDKAKNQEARDNLLNNVLPKLKEAGVTIHTIALSNEADEPLLNQLASQTDGWYQKALFADELQSVFLKIFGQATERESIPLVDNLFRVDENITEFTLLVFKSANDQPTKLITPQGGVLESTNDTPEVSWFESDGYDVITVSAPMTGQWQVDAAIDPDNQVLVVSNIKVHSSAIPNNLLANEKITYSMHLTQENERLTDPDFLSLLNISIEMDSATGNSIDQLEDDGIIPDTAAADGKYTVNIYAPDAPGLAEITAMVDSPTFQRLKQQAVNVYDSPIAFNYTLSEDIAKSHSIKISPLKSVVKTSDLALEVSAVMPDGIEIEVPLAFDPETGTYSGDVEVVESGGKYEFDFLISGTTQNGRSFSVANQYGFQAPALIVPEPEPVIEPATESTPEPEKETDWVFWFSVAGGLNVAFIIFWILTNIIGKKRNLALARSFAQQLETSNG